MIQCYMGRLQSVQLATLKIQNKMFMKSYQEINTDYECNPFSEPG